MKYSDKNPPWICMQKNSACYKGTGRMNILGILIHSTGANNPNLRRYVQPHEKDADYKRQMEKFGKNKLGNDWNHIYIEVGMNAWIGKDATGNVMSVQTMPWNFRPWGCYQGVNGSCNDGWIQFEICEDNLNSKDYFEKIYNEACELTAYLCKKYNLNPKGSVKKNGVIVPVILCHQDSARLGFGSNHGDVLHWFPKYGKDMDDFRNDVANLLKIEENLTTPTITTNKIYRVRKEWNKPMTQIGAFRDLARAKIQCDSAGPDYEVYNEAGEVVYPLIKESISFSIGNEVKLKPNARYISGKAVPSWLYGMTLYIREVQKNHRIVISTLKTGPITGIVYEQYLEKITKEQKVDPYIFNSKVDKLPVHAGPGKQYNMVTTISKNISYTIIAENNNFGKLKSGVGWVELSKIQKKEKK